MNNFSTKILLMWVIGIATFVAFLIPSQSKADYCTPQYSYAAQYMGINYVEIGDMSNSSDWAGWPGYTYYDTKVISVKPTDMVNFTVEFGYTYEMELSIFIDWNQDGTFDESTELVYGSGGQWSWQGYSDKFQVPDDASIGTTRMRVMTEYSGMSGSHPTDPCGTKYYYGECEDYVVNVLPNSPDASITALTSPVKPFRVGNQNVGVTLRSNNKATLSSVWVDWWVNNVAQTPYFWKGTLTQGNTANINLGTVNLDYPANSTYGPFNFRFTTRNANDFPQDADPSNDTYITNISPILNEAGVVGFFGPPEGFGPGITQVRARVRNYAPKPLTSITINWKIDNVAQTPVTLTGINIPRDQTQDLIIGSYNFYAKTPLGPFTVECVSSNPNGVTDEDLTNDKYTGGIGPSLAAGTYTIGGAAAHFASPSEAASYINSSGVFGNGKVTFMVNPGTYNGQLILNSPLPRKNPIEFIGNSNFLSDIVITANSTAQNNFVVLVDGMSDISFSKMTFKNNNNNTGNAGNLITAKNTIGLTFNKISFQGVANSPRNKVEYSLINLLNCSNVVIYENTFNNGSVGFYSFVNTPILPNINLNTNDFYNCSWLGIYNQLADNIPAGNISFNDNRFISNAGLAPVGGIASWNATSIARNEFTGIVGTGAATDAVIYVKHTVQNPNNKANITNNRINQSTNVNGIMIDGAETFVNKNYVSTVQSGNFGLAAFRSNNAAGLVGNNQFISKNMYGVNITNSPKIELYYNSIISESNTYATANINGGGKFMRNIYFNTGTAPVLQVVGSPVSNQNILFTRGTVVVNDNGTNHNTLAAWQAKGFDIESAFTEVEFESFNDLHVKYYNPALFKSTPLFSDPTSVGGIIESSDLFGTPRTSYFAGSHELVLSITIERQTDGFVDCAGSTTNYLTVSSMMNYNAPMTYQWELDGKAIGGETQPIIYFKNLRHSQSGMYRCLISGPGATKSIYSRDVSVYVTRPTDITHEPEPQFVQIGSLGTLQFDAHVNGKDIESAIANDEVKVKWFKYVDEANDIALVDNNWISGSKSNYLTFSKFRLSDAGEYYAVIEGLCGTVKTTKVSITEEVINLTIVDVPKEQSLCTGKNVTFSVNATTGSNHQISYQWSKDGIDLVNQNGKIIGANTNTLMINNLVAADRGNYSVMVKLLGTTLFENPAAKLQVVVSPVITTQPMDVTVQTGKSLSLDLVAEGTDANEVLVYKWYKDGVWVSTSNESAYTADPVTVDDGGDYYVEVSNDCGMVKSNTVKVSVTTSTTSVVEVSKNGYSLTTALPNPVSGNSIITFAVPTESYVKVTLTDASGASRVVLTEGNFGEGNHNINIDANKLNIVSGTYFYFLESNGVRLAQKMVVIR